jgi:hypothetical protein
MLFILELRRRVAPSSDARFCCLPLLSAMSTIALARAPSSALALAGLALALAPSSALTCVHLAPHRRR